MIKPMERSEVAGLFDSDRRFLTLGGIETYLIFQQGVELREFAAFELYDDDQAYRTYLERHVEPIADAARHQGYGLLLDCMVYMASPDALAKLGYDGDDVARINRNAVEQMQAFRTDWRQRSQVADGEIPMLTVGDMGPRGDGYGHKDDEPASSEEARAYHGIQIRALAGAGVDLLGVYTQTNVAEAVGITLAAKESGLPLFVSATIETDGNLPDGTSLRDFIEGVDAATESYPLFYMVNCAHPIHVAPVLDAATGEPWLDRLRGLRANASSRTHAELDGAPKIDRGDPQDFGQRMAALATSHALHVVGGCCGTDAEHVRAVADRAPGTIATP